MFENNNKQDGKGNNNEGNVAQGVRKGTSRLESARRTDTTGSGNLSTTGSVGVRSDISENVGRDDNDVNQKDFF